MEPDRHGRLCPNIEGWAKPICRHPGHLGRRTRHRVITDAVHAEGGKIALQILHTGRYGYHPLCVAPSRLQSPISPFTPRELSSRGIERRDPRLRALRAPGARGGYDGVEVMASEGYFLNQFLATHTNHRQDDWGGSYESACACR